MVLSIQLVGRAGVVVVVLAAASALFPAESPPMHPVAASALGKLDIDRGIIAVLGLSDDGDASMVTDLARGSQRTIYFQSGQADEVARVRDAAANAGLLGTRVFADVGRAPQSTWTRTWPTRSW